MKRKKIEIVKDRDNELLNSIKSHAHEETKASDNKILEEPVDHVCAARSLPLPSPTCSECSKHEFCLDQTEIEAKFEMVLALLIVNSKRKGRMKR